MNAGDSAPGGIHPLPSPPKLAPLLATLGSSHRSVAALAHSTHKVAVATGAHLVAAEMAVASAHMEAAARYDRAAHLLARRIDSSTISRSALSAAYGRRIMALLGRSAALSARTSRIAARMSRRVPDGGLASACDMRDTSSAIEENARLTRETRESTRENLSLRAKIVALRERTARPA